MSLERGLRSIGPDQSPSSWEIRLNQEGINTTVTPDFKDKICIVPGEPMDQLTGLPIETDEMRRTIAQRLGEAIKKDEKAVCLYVDLDNLKTTNYIDRELGNQIIKADAANVCTMAEAIFLDKKSKFVVRQTKAADETVAWFFGINDEQITQLREKTTQLNNRRQTLTVDKDNSLVLSTTAAVVCTDDPRFIKIVQDTKTWIKENTGQGIEMPPWNTYKEIKKTAEDDTKILKIAKDLARLPVEELGVAESRKEVKEILVRTIANTRVSEPLARTVLSIMDISSLTNQFSTPVSRNIMYKELHVNPHSSLAKWLTVEDLRVMYFDKLLHEIYKESGFESE